MEGGGAVTDTLYDSPDWAAFVDAVRATPGDDTVRLVAADWLDEHGEGDRAELIRVGCEWSRLCNEAGARMAALPAGQRVTDTPGFQEQMADPCEELAKRSMGVIRQGAARWVDRWVPDGWRVDVRTDDKRGSLDLVSGEMRRPLAFVFGKGFLERVSGPWDWWRDNADDLLRREPVRRVRFPEPLTYNLYTRACKEAGVRPEYLGYEVNLADTAAVLTKRWPQVPAGGWEIPLLPLNGGYLRNVTGSWFELPVSEAVRQLSDVSVIQRRLTDDGRIRPTADVVWQQPFVQQNPSRWAMSHWCNSDNFRPALSDDMVCRPGTAAMNSYHYALRAEGPNGWETVACDGYCGRCDNCGTAFVTRPVIRPPHDRLEWTGAMPDIDHAGTHVAIRQFDTLRDFSRSLVETAARGGVSGSEPECDR